ncbi:MAG: M35 family metallo-endopeptidase, partial [Acidobacteria bacterium]|nr:M35 family metallo-endopeptidase [Acidobacteriota bacterium]
AFRGSGQSERGVRERWISDISGQPQPNRVSKANLNFWFAGPDGVVSNGSKSHIASSFEEIFEATKSDDFDIDCENNSSCDGANAYVNWGGYDVNLCPNFWTKGDRVRGSIQIHELSHGYADTDDYFYYTKYPSNQPFNSLFETVSLRENADTYESFVRDVYF